MNKLFVSIVVFVSIFIQSNLYSQCGIVIDTVYYNGDYFLTPDTIKVCQAIRLLLLTPMQVAPRI